MEQILVAREGIVKFFKRFEVFILPLLKFVLGLIIFNGINSIGYMHSAIEPLGGDVSPGLISVLFALLFVVMPMNMSWIVIILTITMQFSSNMEIALSVFIFLIFVFLFYARMATKESILIIFTIMAFRFNVPYLIPIIAGLYFNVTSVIPVTVGVFLNAQLDGVFRLAMPVAGTAAADRDFTEILGEIPDTFSEIYTTIMGVFAGTDWIFTALTFAAVIVLVYFISRLSIDYSKEISIGLGCVMLIFGSIISALFATGGGINLGITILSTIICGALAFVIRFFDGILDYQRAESVQFEDDNNYYHVRIVPKVILTKSQRVVKRIRPQMPENPLDDGMDDHDDRDRDDRDRPRSEA